MLWEEAQGDTIDYDSEVVLDENGNDNDTADHKGIKLFKVTINTKKILTIVFPSASPNTTRRQCTWWSKFGTPHTNAIAYPNLYKIIMDRLSPVTKSPDRKLAKQQVLLLDVNGLISFILEEAAKSQLNQKSAIEAALTELKLLGNASMHASQERRKNALQNMNPQLADMGDDDANYRTAV